MKDFLQNNEVNTGLTCKELVKEIVSLDKNGIINLDNFQHASPEMSDNSPQY